MKELINNLRYITSIIADILQVSRSSVENHLYQLAYILQTFFPLYDSFEKPKENDPHIPTLVLRKWRPDEAWIIYNSVKCKLSF